MLPDFLSAGVSITDIFASYEPHVRTLLQTYAPGLGVLTQAITDNELRIQLILDADRRCAYDVTRLNPRNPESPPAPDRRPLRRVVQHPPARRRARAGSGALTVRPHSPAGRRPRPGPDRLPGRRGARSGATATTRTTAPTRPSTRSSTPSVAAEKAARDAVTRMTTYSYRTVEEDFAWVDEAGTEKFQENFAGASEDAVDLHQGR